MILRLADAFKSITKAFLLECGFVTHPEYKNTLILKTQSGFEILATDFDNDELIVLYHEEEHFEVTCQGDLVRQLQGLQEPGFGIGVLTTSEAEVIHALLGVVHQTDCLLSCSQSDPTDEQSKIIQTESVHIDAVHGKMNNLNFAAERATVNRIEPNRLYTISQLTATALSNIYNEGMVPK
jgi:hypothetical protein